MRNREDESGGLLDPALIADVVRRLNATDIDELEIRDGSSRLYLRREPGLRTIVDPDSAPARGDGAAEGVALTAPLTGVFYARPAPDEPAFAEVGSHVEVDDVVALIETMKLFNEVKSEIAGRVTKIVAQDGDLVEVGHPLMYVVESGEEG